jgi:hypothetical protein
MSGIRELPERVIEFLEAGVVAEFATVSTAGVPIDTPTYYFPADDLTTFDVATGLVNPSKAERVRRNPKVGLLMEGAATEPVVSMRGHAAVRDTDFDANALRYISETGFRSLGRDLTWDDARKAVQYWTRIIIEVTPTCILWWDTPVAMDGPPHVWRAPASTTYPTSDPVPPGETTRGLWPVPAWQDLAQAALAKGRVPHVTVCDEDGYPMPIRVRQFELVEDGFKFVTPHGVPWPIAGKATLSFEGHMIFVGAITLERGTTFLKVARALPQNAAALSSQGVIKPNQDMVRLRQARLDEELKRRGKSIPVIPRDEPPPTRMAKLRQARIASGAPITGFNVDR